MKKYLYLSVTHTEHSEIFLKNGQLDVDASFSTITSYLNLHPEADEDYKCIGELETDCVPLYDIDGNIVHPVNAFEGSVELEDICSALYDEDGEPCAELQKVCPESAIMSSVVYVIQTAKINKEYRGEKFGLYLVYNLLQHLDSKSKNAIVICKPAPIESHKDMETGDFGKVSFKEGQTKLRKYWSRLGFKRVGKTEYYALDFAERQPNWSKTIKNFKLPNMS